ncbi:MAG: glycosyltransferase [Bacteroidia bacterium]|nr:glycosyltransferase [Bacteroidia bacterium]
MDIGLILFVGFCVVAGIQLFYYLFLFTGVFKKRSLPPVNLEGVSVVICTRNNRPFLEANLDAVLHQDHPNFEVIVVNDGSTDGTIDFLDKLDKQHNHLNVLHLDIDERFHRGKKFAQTIGIKAAKNDQLIFTDADCKPASDQWLRETARHFTEGTDLVLGVGNYTRQASLTNWIIQLETFHSLLFYINMALARMPYMGVGRNLAYRRELFFKVKGFASHQHLLSGDDDLFVNETATKTNTAVNLAPEAFTVSEPKKSIGTWMKQKKRHFSTGKLYKPKHRFILGLYSFSLFLYYALGSLTIYSLFFDYAIIQAESKSLITHGGLLIAASTIVLVRLFTQGIVLYKNMKVFDYKKYFWVFPFFDLGILFIQIFIGIRGYYSKPQRWNS